MGNLVLELRGIDHTRVAIAGGKGAQLAALSRIAGVPVPDGFAVTTAAFERVMAAAPSMNGLLDRLSHLKPDDREAIGSLSAAIRQTVEETEIPDDVAEEVAGMLTRLGEHGSFAVRSSATAEDMPTASFAGQHDTYLHVVGQDAILRHIRQCWASLFTERAVTYRIRQGVDHRAVRMAVVVQRMVVPRASGVLFTADPLTGNRKVTSVEAVFGLGEALVSGRVNTDVYTERDAQVTVRTVGAGLPATKASTGDGTHAQAQEQPQGEQRVLTDAEVVQLARTGRRIEAHFGRPQDIEWCLAGGDFWFVQSRPITTLFPVPEAADGENHVYVSVGHQQMMTDAMKPLGLSFWQMTTPRRMAEAGGRLFVDVTRLLASPASRASFLEMAGRSDPLMRDALETVLDRGDFIQSSAGDGPGWVPPGAAADALDADPAIVIDLIAQTQASIAALKRGIQAKTGTALLDFILMDLHELKRLLFDLKSHQVFMSAMEATWWLNERLDSWLGEKNAADTLTQSVPHNVTSEMGLALLDVADAIRPHAEVVAFLEQVEDGDFLTGMSTLEGGREARAAIEAWLENYGMRGTGEIDITRPRWRERPGLLLPLLLEHVRNFAPGASARRFERGRQEAWTKEQQLLERVRALPGGGQKAEKVKRMIDRVRTFIGYREYPKYGMVSRYFVYKQALLEEAARLVRAGVLHERDDIFWLTFQEIQDVVRTHRVDRHIIRERAQAFGSYRTLTPPRVLTSEGEGLSGAYRRHGLPAGVLAGLPVSSGVIEGRARVLLDMADADLEAGDILVTAYTDPSWTPLFIAVAGLVTEVGGLMTHGAVIAREYGLPAVVGVAHATQLIRDGQRIRVHGTDGYVEILDGAANEHQPKRSSTGVGHGQSAQLS